MRPELDPAELFKATHDLANRFSRLTWLCGVCGDGLVYGNWCEFCTAKICPDCATVNRDNGAVVCVECSEGP